MKKLLSMVLLLIGVVGLSACGLTASQDELLTSNQDIYAFSAISSTSLLAQGYESQPLSYQLGDSDETLIEQELPDINHYLNMMEQFLGTNGGFSIETVESDRAEYNTKIVFTSVDLLGNPVVHTLYFNEELLSEATTNPNLDLSIAGATQTDYDLEEADEVEEDEVKEDEVEEEDETEVESEIEDEDEDENEDEFEDQETVFNGILIMNEMEYSITGKKEIEDEEEKIVIISYIDDLNYVKVISKVEDNERKYSYEVVTNGEVVTSSKLKIEEEENESKFVLEYVNGQTSGEFEFKREVDDNEDIIKIKYEINDGTTTESGEAKILVITDPITGDTTYQYKVKADDHDEIELEEERDDDTDEDHEDDVDDTALYLS